MFCKDSRTVGNNGARRRSQPGQTSHTTQRYLGTRNRKENCLLLQIATGYFRQAPIRNRSMIKLLFLYAYMAVYSFNTKHPVHPDETSGKLYNSVRKQYVKSENYVYCTIKTQLFNVLKISDAFLCCFYALLFKEPRFTEGSLILLGYCLMLCCLRFSATKTRLNWIANDTGLLSSLEFNFKHH